MAKLPGSDTVYYLKWSTLSSGKNESPLAKGNLKMTGKLPDHITIERVWTGSPVDAFDLSSDRTTLKTDDDTGEFSLNITTSFGTNPKVTHNRGKCYYLELSDGTVYTLVVDNDASEQTLTREPSVVQLYNESDATTPIPDAFFVAESPIGRHKNLRHPRDTAIRLTGNSAVRQVQSGRRRSELQKK